MISVKKLNNSEKNILESVFLSDKKELILTFNTKNFFIDHGGESSSKKTITQIYVSFDDKKYAYRIDIEGDYYLFELKNKNKMHFLLKKKIDNPNGKTYYSNPLFEKL